MLKKLTDKVLICFFILLLVSNGLFAFSSSLQPIFTLTTGAFISQSGQSQSFAPLDRCRYRYNPYDSNTTAALWGGFVGSEVMSSSRWGFTTGLGYYQPNVFSTKGIVIQGADLVSDDTYHYRYQTQSQQVLAESKFYWIANEKLQPFLMLGLGMAFNHVSDYQTNVPPFLEFTPAFTNDTQTNFTYAIGPGIDLRLSKSFRIGMAYRFTDLGLVSTGRARLDSIPISSRLKQSHLYANQTLLQLTFTPWARS